MKKLVIPTVAIATVIALVYLIFGSFEQTFFSALDELKSNQVQYSLFSFLILSSDFILPVPSSIVMYLNGVVLGIIPGAILSFISLMITAIAGYYTGALIPLRDENKSEKTNAMFIRYGPSIIIITRGIPILSESICIVCGLNRMPLKWYLMLNAVGYFPLCILYAYFGYIGKEENTFFPAILSAILITVLFWLLGQQLTARIQKA